jgi:uncharacterized protein YciI
MKHFFFTIHKTAKRAEVTDEYALGVLHEHTAYFKQLGREGKCLIAGPFKDQTTDLGGGCYVFAAETEDEAKKMASADPLVVEGLYDFRIYEWMKVVPE